MAAKCLSVPVHHVLGYCLVGSCVMFVLFHRSSPLHISDIFTQMSLDQAVSALHNIFCIFAYALLTWKVRKDRASVGLSGQHIFAITSCEVGSLLLRTAPFLVREWELLSIVCAVICFFYIMRYQ
eukprot:Selendium_serpulae@DN11157_c0_g1_i1.p1